MMSPFVIPFVVPIYLVGLFTGNCIHKRLAKKETKIDMTNDHISPMMNAEPSCSANPNSSESMSESMPTGYKISLKKITSPITTSILVLTFIAITFGITYDFKRDSIEGDAKKYLLNSKQVNDKTGHIKDVQSAFIARNAQSNRQRAVHVFYVQSERGNFTVLINVDGYVINPKFSLNEIRDGYMQIGEYLPV